MVIFSERKLCIWTALADLTRTLACIFLVSLAYVLNCPLNLEPFFIVGLDGFFGSLVTL